MDVINRVTRVFHSSKEISFDDSSRIILMSDCHRGDGSCVHPRCITGIEISEGNIMLIKWCTKAKDDGTLFIRRDVIAGPRRIKEFLNKISEKISKVSKGKYMGQDFMTLYPFSKGKAI